MGLFTLGNTLKISPLVARIRLALQTLLILQAWWCAGIRAEITVEKFYKF